MTSRSLVPFLTLRFFSSSSLLPLAVRFPLSSPTLHPSPQRKTHPRMSAVHHSQAGPPIHTIHLSGGEPVQVVAARGLSESDFRSLPLPSLHHLLVLHHHLLFMRGAHLQFDHKNVGSFEIEVCLCPRNAIDSALFKQWLKNMQSEPGILANGSMSLRQVLIQVVIVEK